MLNPSSKASALTSHTPSSVAVKVRDHVHMATHSLSVILGTFKLRGSPPIAGSANK